VAVNLAFEAAATGGEVLLVDADTYGGAVAQANIREHHRILRSRPKAQAMGASRLGGE
jgi:Mrp family chromosome partitioning ATPase